MTPRLLSRVAVEGKRQKAEGKRSAAFFLLPFTFCLLPFALGCGKPPVKLVLVSGKILVDGKPLTFGSIQFRADTSHGNTSMEGPTGQVQPDGTFVMMTGTRPGAPLGWWKVLVIADNFQVWNPPLWAYHPPDVEPPPKPEKWEPPKPLVHERYLTINTTDLTVEVVENPPEGAYVLKLNP
jgi:hypothetical protein